jgi:hypothetical protein
MKTLRWMLVSTIALAALTACPPDEPNPTFDGGGVVYCSSTSDCQAPLLCIDYVCRTAPPDAGQRDYGLADRRPDALALDQPAPDQGQEDAVGEDSANRDAHAEDAPIEDAHVEDAHAEDAHAEDVPAEDAVSVDL